jgi:asparagine synthetase B (glutamine-hydrolysing)
MPVESLTPCAMRERRPAPRRYVGLGYDAGSMLAGISDPRGGRDRAEVAGRLRAAAGEEAAGEVRFAGALAVLSDSASGPDADGPGCALQGTIYNRRELAIELGADPSHSAESLVARGFERWGEGLLPRLRGAFSLVVWSPGGERIVLASDQTGPGALFVHRSGDRLTFASEIRLLLGLLPRTPDPDEVALVRWLGLANRYDLRTMFEGVRRVGAGRRIVIERGRLDHRRY